MASQPAGQRDPRPGVVPVRRFALLLAGVALLCGACGETGSGRTPPQRRPTIAALPSFFGRFAGYSESLPHVRVVHASWQVPRILPGSGPGAAGTWIGAQAAGAPNAPFIQLGTNEEQAPGAMSRPARQLYFAFWSDTEHRDHPDALFIVRPGDIVAATLSLTPAGWRVLLRDRTLGRSASFLTHDEFVSRFTDASLMQEDILNATSKPPAPFPYPSRMTPVRFSGISINMHRISSVGLTSSCMSENHVVMFPTAFGHRSFSLATASFTRYSPLPPTCR